MFRSQNLEISLRIELCDWLRRNEDPTRAQKFDAQPIRQLALDFFGRVLETFSFWDFHSNPHTEILISVSR